MFKQLLFSITIVPVILGMQAARGGRTRTAMYRLLVWLLAFDVLYWIMLYWVRYRWVG